MHMAHDIAGRLRARGDRAGHLGTSTGHRMVPGTQQLLQMGQLRMKHAQGP
jgi:hypothetical protein